MPGTLTGSGGTPVNERLREAMSELRDAIVKKLRYMRDIGEEIYTVLKDGDSHEEIFGKNYEVNLSELIGGYLEKRGMEENFERIRGILGLGDNATYKLSINVREGPAHGLDPDIPKSVALGNYVMEINLGEYTLKIVSALDNGSKRVKEAVIEYRHGDVKRALMYSDRNLEIISTAKGVKKAEVAYALLVLGMAVMEKVREEIQNYASSIEEVASRIDGL